MRDPAPPYLVIDHLNLGAFATVYQKTKSIQGHYLAGRVTVKSRHGGVISKDGYCEHVIKCDDVKIGKCINKITLKKG